jgi:hypothetical protein
MRMLGDELRDLRLSRGHTRGTLVSRLPADITAQTLASYELGARHCTVQRLFDICEVLDASAADVLDSVLRRLHQGVATTGLTIDLRALARSTSVRLRPLRRWAIIACEQRPDLTHTTLSSASVALAAELCGTTVSTLTNAINAVQPTNGKSD